MAIRSDVGSTIVHDSVRLPCLEVSTDGRSALVGCDIGLEGDNLGNGLDRG